MRFGFSRGSRGYLVVLILVFGSVFMLVFSSLIGLVVTQKRLSSHAVANEKAFHIAEAGLDYYKWFLAHYPGDLTNGTTTDQPYIHRYRDPEGAEIGQFELTITGAQNACGYVGAVDITSVGRLDAYPNVSRAVAGRYARPNIAEYTGISDAVSSIGATTNIVGPYHSNGSITMSGQSNSIMTSAVSISGSGGDQALWQYPVPPIDFDGMAVNLADIKTRAVASGIYFPPSTDNGSIPDVYPTAKGYHVILNANDTITVYRVNTVDTTWAYDEGPPAAFFTDSILLTSPASARTLLGTYAIPENCSVIYFEDKVWLEGVVNQKVTIAAGNIIDINVEPSIILSNNITYTTYDGTAGLLAIAENDVALSLTGPNTMTVNGIFVAQNGTFGRYRYCPPSPAADCASSVTGHQGMNSSYSSYRYRDWLTVNGTRVFKDRSILLWSDSGVRNRIYSYDRTQIDNPPPLIPATSLDYGLSSWREILPE